MICLRGGFQSDYMGKLGIFFLSGCYVITRFNSREEGFQTTCQGKVGVFFLAGVM